jgi:uncharacterized protein
MILPDVNLLLYAQISGFAEHTVARKWWRAALESDVAVGLAPPAVFGFIRIATNAKVFREPLSIDKASDVITNWLSFSNVVVLTAGPEHLTTVLRLLRDSGTSGNLTTDAQLAAFAIEYQATLCSNDADFGRFSGLRWNNPLQKSKPPKR